VAYARRVTTKAEARRELLELHRQVKFTNVNLDIRDAEVCLTCHSHLDRPNDWPEDDEPAWEFPLVQDPYPCRTRQLIDILAKNDE
jgi:hypothetical protein